MAVSKKKPAKARSTEQRKHNPKTRKVHPILPASPNRPELWTNWYGSKDHLFPVGIECKSSGGVPEHLRETVKVFYKAVQFRDRRTCVACFERYVAKQKVIDAFSIHQRTNPTLLALRRATSRGVPIYAVEAADA